MKKRQYPTLGKYILDHLYLLGKTQEQLAQEVETTPLTIHNIISGKTSLSIKMSKKIAPAIGVDEIDLRKVALAGEAGSADEIGA